MYNLYRAKRKVVFTSRSEVKDKFTPAYIIFCIIALENS